MKEKFGNITSVLVTLDEIESVLPEVSLAVNATPVGMEEGDDRMPFPIEKLSKDAIVYDIVYNRETKLIQTARELGMKYFDGAEMLIGQGALSFKHWTGISVDKSFDIMRKALYKQLGRKS